MNWESLIALSRLLADPHNGSNADPDMESVRLRRAVSTAYYAMFHALARNNADALIGESETERGTSAWHRIYRALDHRAAYRELRDNALTDSHNQVKQFGNVFRRLQRERHTADYDPQSSFSSSDTLQLIDDAESAINDFLAVPSEERRDLAALVLFPARG